MRKYVLYANSEIERLTLRDGILDRIAVLGRVENPKMVLTLVVHRGRIGFLRETRAKTMKSMSRYAVLTLSVAMAATCSTYAQSVQQSEPSPLLVNRSDTKVDTSPPNSVHGTVVVGIALSEGIVLAGDSRLTQTGPIMGFQSRVLSDNGSKVFSVGKFGVATYGEAFLQGRTIASWVDDYRSKENKPTDDIDAFGTKFSAFIQNVYDESFPIPKNLPPNTPAPQRPVLGFLMAGYDVHGIGKLMFMEFPGSPAPQSTHDTHQNTGAQWNGQTDVIQRLVMGYDPALGFLPAFNSISNDQKAALGQQLPRLQYNIAWNGLMLQDGIDLASTFIKTTINMQRFANGTLLMPVSIPGVGGTIDVLVVKPTGVEWVKHKNLIAD